MCDVHGKKTGSRKRRCSRRHQTRRGGFLIHWCGWCGVVDDAAAGAAAGEDGGAAAGAVGAFHDAAWESAGH